MYVKKIASTATDEFSVWINIYIYNNYIPVFIYYNILTYYYL